GHALEESRKQGQQEKRRGEGNRERKSAEYAMDPSHVGIGGGAAEAAEKRRDAREADDRKGQGHEHGAQQTALPFARRREPRQPAGQLDLVHAEQTEREENE